MKNLRKIIYGINIQALMAQERGIPMITLNLFLYLTRLYIKKRELNKLVQIRKHPGLVTQSTLMSQETIPNKVVWNSLLLLQTEEGAARKMLQ